LQEMFDIMADTPDENGFITMHQLRKIIAPVGKQLTSREIFGSDKNPTTSTNATNVFNGLLTLSDVIHWGILDKYNANAWYGMDMNHDLHWFNHGSPMAETWEDKHTQSFIHDRTLLISFGHYDWRGWVASPGV